MVIRLLSIATSMLVALVFSTANLAFADDKIDPGFRDAVAKFLIVQRTPQMTENQLTYLISQQALRSVAASGISVTEPMQLIVADAARTTLGARFNDVEYLTELYAPLYAEHFSEKEIRELIAFWESPTGQKTIELMPKIAEGQFAILQKASASSFPSFEEEVDKRLIEAGINLAPQSPEP